MWAEHWDTFNILFTSIIIKMVTLPLPLQICSFFPYWLHISGGQHSWTSFPLASGGIGPEGGSWRGWDGGSGKGPGSVCSWCALPAALEADGLHCSIKSHSACETALCTVAANSLWGLAAPSFCSQLGVVTHVIWMLFFSGQDSDTVMTMA